MHEVIMSAFGGRLRMIAALAMTVTVSACAARGAAPRPFPGAPGPPGATTPSPGTAPSSPPAASAVVATALSLRGTQYRNGGSEPTRGFDCSGLVQWVFAQHGAALPRETREQYDFGRTIKERDVRPGDLVFFKTVRDGASHVGIALGGGDFIHAPTSRGVVRVESYLTSDYWSRRWLGARRVL